MVQLHHLLAVFDRQTATAPVGLTAWEAAAAAPIHPIRPAAAANADNEAHEREACRGKLERAYSNSSPKARKLELLGHGNGFTFEASPYCSYAAGADGVHVLFAGEVGAWPGVDAVGAAHDAFMRGAPPPEANDAAWLLDLYRSFFPPAGAAGAGTEYEFDAAAADAAALESLAAVGGSFAFVIFDALHYRVFAARDAAGAQPLWWGATAEGSLMIGSCPEDLAECEPSATPFPAGTLFASERHTLAYSPGERGWVINDALEWPGRLLSFVREPDGERWRGVKAVPRLTPAGAVCGAVYRVASARALGGEGGSGGGAR